MSSVLRREDIHAGRQFSAQRSDKSFHDNPEYGHFGALRMAELVSRDFYWPSIHATIRKYVAGYEIGDLIKVPCHACHRLNMPRPPPFRPWEGVTMDFITDLPKSTSLGFTGILVVIERLTKMAITVHCREDIDSPELDRMLFEYVICNHGVPDDIITDLGTQFTCRFGTQVCSHMSIDHRLPTAFHPQTDGQTNRQTQTMEQYLPAFCNYEHDNWVELRPRAEFAYNYSVHASTTITPFWAMYHRHPKMQLRAPKAPANLKSEIQTDALLEGLEETH